MFPESQTLDTTSRRWRTPTKRCLLGTRSTCRVRPNPPLECTASAAKTSNVLASHSLMLVEVEVGAVDCSNAYVGRTGNLAFFVATGTNLTSAPTYGVVGTTVTVEDQPTTAPVAKIFGSITVMLTFGGHGYTTAAIAFLGGDGTSITATPTIASGAITGLP